MDAAVTTPRPWKERREEIEKLKNVFAGHVRQAFDDCLGEIDRRGELIGWLADALIKDGPPHGQGRREGLLRKADKVSNG